MERDTNDLRKLGALVRRERKAARQGQDDFARQLGLSVRNLSNVENGVRVGRGSYSLLETHFKWDPGSAATGEPTRNGHPADQPPAEPATVQVGDILDFVDSLNLLEEDRRFIRAKIRKAAGLVPDLPPSREL